MFRLVLKRVVPVAGWLLTTFSRALIERVLQRLI
jgi:hypothetical protein